MNENLTLDEYHRLYGIVSFNAQRLSEYAASLEAKVRQLEDEIVHLHNTHPAPSTQDTPAPVIENAPQA